MNYTDREKLTIHSSTMPDPLYIRYRLEDNAIGTYMLVAHQCPSVTNWYVCRWYKWSTYGDAEPQEIHHTDLFTRALKDELHDAFETMWAYTQYDNREDAIQHVTVGKLYG